MIEKAHSDFYTAGQTPSAFASPSQKLRRQSCDYCVIPGPLGWVPRAWHCADRGWTCVVWSHTEPLQGRGCYEEIRRVGEAGCSLSMGCVRSVAPKGCLVAGSIGSYGASPWPQGFWLAFIEAPQWCRIYGRFSRPGDTNDLSLELELHPLSLTQRPGFPSFGAFAYPGTRAHAPHVAAKTRAGQRASLPGWSWPFLFEI